tara:strand:- start:1187 stop:1912 length:726 start_codon:yes stop_codon:yes gene_type:complete
MAKDKSLQKLTDFDQIKTKKQVREFLDANPNNAQDLLDCLLNQYNVSTGAKEGKEYKLEELIAEIYKHKNLEEGEREFRNHTYESNHHLITSTINNSILDNNCFPSISQIKDKTGLSRQTIYNHLNCGLKSNYNRLVMGKLEYMAVHALSKLYLIGVKDNNASALKHFIELSGAINRNPIERVNSYVQINNVTITQEDIKNLPPKSIEAITKLLSEARNDKQVIDMRQIQKGMEYSSSAKD